MTLDNFEFKMLLQKGLNFKKSQYCNYMLKKKLPWFDMIFNPIQWVFPHNFLNKNHF